MKQVDDFSKSDPFLVICRPGPDYLTEEDGTKVPEDQWFRIVDTTFIKDESNPRFDPFTIDGRSLSRGMENTQFKIEIWDSDNGPDQDKFISRGYFSLYGHLIHKNKIETFDEDGKLAGTLIVKEFERKDLYSIVQHIN